MSDRSVIATDNAPEAVASYSQAIATGGFVFCSGQIGLDPGTGEMVEGSVVDETRRCLDNLTAVLEAAGSGWDRVVKVTVYLADIDDYAAFNDVYAEYVTDEAPARAAFAVSGLPKGARVEVECVAAL